MLNGGRAVTGEAVTVKKRSTPPRVGRPFFNIAGFSPMVEYQCVRSFASATPAPVVEIDSAQPDCSAPTPSSARTPEAST